MRRQRQGRHPTSSVLALPFLVLAGCASSPPEHFYTLGPEPVPGQLQAPATAYRIAVGPITVPAIVDRPQMVLRVGPNRVQLAEQSRWAEPLKDSIARAIAGNLAQLLHDDQVSAFPQGLSYDADYQVQIDVQEFESAPGDAATIGVLWAVRAPGAPRKEGRSLVREPVAVGDYDALVRAHNRALLSVSRDIAAAVRDAAASRR